MSETLFCEEVYGSRGRKQIYAHSSKSNQIFVIDDSDFQKKTSKTKFSIRTATDILKEAFLPQGYPDSVSEDYLSYQVWDSLQAFMSRLMSTLSTQAVLKGIGVGDEYTTPLAATITWLLRDGTSMMGRIIFTWYEGTSLDYNSKQWRLFADVMNDVAMCFDLLAAHMGSLSTSILCVAGVCRAMVEASGSATRAAFVQHQAKRGNLADVAAKDGSQETLVNLSGLLTSIILLQLVANSTTLVWTFYFLFTLLHLFFNYKAVRAVSMNSLNQLRLSILVEKFLLNSDRMPTVRDVNLEEPVILGSKSCKINLGCSFKQTNIPNLPIDDVLKIYEKSTYILTLKKMTKEIFITLHKDSNDLSQLEGSFQAHVILLGLRNNDDIEQSSLLKSNQYKSASSIDILRWSREITNKHFPAFLETIKMNGWETKSNLLGSEEWRAKWKL